MVLHRTVFPREKIGQNVDCWLPVCPGEAGQELASACSPGSVSSAWSETVRLMTDLKPREDSASWRKRYQEIETVL